MKQNKIPRNEYIRKPVGKTNPYKHDVLYTNLGQWKYPGQITRIPSNDITMQGVLYPVYGEDDLGYGQMMYPGMDYTFPGEYVTEIPMAQKGIQTESKKIDPIKKYEELLKRDAEIYKKIEEAENTTIFDKIYTGLKNKAKSDYETIKEAGEYVKGLFGGLERKWESMQEEDPRSIVNRDTPKVTTPKTLPSKKTLKTETKKPDISFGYKELYAVPDINRPKDSLAVFTNTFDNDEGAKYYIGHKAKEVTDAGAQKTFTNAKAVAHFLRDSDILPGQKITPQEWKVAKGYKYKTTSPGKTVSAQGFDDPEKFRTLYKPDPSGDGTYRVKYIKNKELTPKKSEEYSKEGWELDLTVSGQHKFSDIDWDKEGPSTGYLAKSKWLPLKNGKHTYIPYKSKKGFSRFSGGSVIYFFKDPKSGKNIGVDVSGSVNDIKEAGEDIINKYGIKPENLELAYHDMGSYSAKPKAHGDKLDYNQWLDYNDYNRGFSGAPLIIPKQKYGGIPMAQKGKQVEDRDSWLENIAEIVDPTGISSWDDIYRAYKNTGLSGETALEVLGAIPLLGKIGKSGKIITGGFGLLQDAVKASKYLPASKQQKFIDKAFDMYQKYNKAGGKELDEALGTTTKILKDKIPYINPNKWSSSDKAINMANKSFKAGRLSDAVQAALGAKDDSGFTWDMRHGEVPKFGGRNIFPQIELGEHGDFAYGGDPSLPNITGHYKTGGWLDKYQPGGRVMPSETTQSQVPAYMRSLPKSLKEAKQKQKKVDEGKAYEKAIQDVYYKYHKDKADKGSPIALGRSLALGVDPIEAKKTIEKQNEEYARNSAAEDTEEYLRPINDEYLKEKGLEYASYLAGPETLGLASLAKQGVKKIGKKVIKAGLEAATERANNLATAFEGTKSLGKEILGELKQSKLNKESIKQGNAWLKDWIEDPATQAKIDKDITEKMAFADYLDDPEKEKNLLKLIEQQSKTFKPSSKQYSLFNQIDENIGQYLLPKQFKKSIHQDNWGASYLHQYTPEERQKIIQGLYKNVPEKYGSWISRSTEIPQENRISTTIHEGTHDWVSSEAMKKTGMRNVSLNNTNPEIKKDFLEWEKLRKEGKDPDKIMGSQRAYQAYLADPTEMHARIMELRHELGINPNWKVHDEAAKNITEWIEKGGSRFVDPSFLKVIDNDPKKLKTLFNRFWGVAPVVGLGSAAVNQEEEGGEIGQDEFRRGGLYTPPKIKRKVRQHGTSKNIQSSINKLFTRNYDVFGPGGRNIYNPKAYKTGGWLDNVD